jgi:hypothetical protein
MFFIAEQYGRKDNNKRTHVSTDSSSSYSSSEMSISPERLASPTPSTPELFYLETKQLPPPQPIGAKTLQFGTTETVPTVLFKHVENGEVKIEDKPLVPASPLTSKAPAQIQIQVERFEAVSNAREADAKTDATTSTGTTTTTTSTNSDKENEAPYAPTSVSPEPKSPEYSNSDVGRGLRLIYNALHTHYAPLQSQTPFDRVTGPTWTDSEEEEEEEEDTTDNWGTPNPADQIQAEMGPHPGEGWYLNDPFTKNYYQVEICSPVTGRYINAPYVTFHIQCDRAEVSATYGRGYAITTRALDPVPVCYLCPSLNPEQIQLLDPSVDFAPAVRRVIDDQFPIHLSAAFVRYQFYRRAQYMAQRHIRQLKEREYKYMEKAIGVLSQMENANVIGRLCAHEDEILHQLAVDQQEPDHFLRLLNTYTGPITLSALDPRANPFRKGANAHQLRPGVADRLCKPRARMCSKERNHYDVENRLQDDADRTEDDIRGRLHQRHRPCIKRCFKCHKHGHIRAECPNRRQPWHARK